MLNQRQIAAIVNTIVKGYHPEKIILFGSYANGNATKDSDLDFCVIKKTSRHYLQRSREIHSLFNPYPWPMDIFVFTPAEFNKRRKVHGTIQFIAETKGKVVYGK